MYSKLLLSSLFALIVFACSSGGSSPPATPSSGGTSSTGGLASTGGGPASGGMSTVSSNVGGMLSTGGVPSAGGTASVGGAMNTGGVVTTGGSPGTGGTPGTGKPTKIPAMTGKTAATRPVSAVAAASVTNVTVVVNNTTIINISTVEGAGDTGDESWTWSTDVDGDGDMEDCTQVDNAESGYTFLTCTGFAATCEDNSTISDAILFVQLAPDGSYSVATAGANLCGSGADLLGCDYDENDVELSCGICAVGRGGEDIVCSPAVGTQCLDDADCTSPNICNEGTCEAALSIPLTPSPLVAKGIDHPVSSTPTVIPFDQPDVNLTVQGVNIYISVTHQANYAGSNSFTWTENIDGDDAMESCTQVEDTENNSVFTICDGYAAECPNGSIVDSALFTETEADGSFTLGTVGDPCQLGAAPLAGCDYDAQGNEVSCGNCAQEVSSVVITCAPANAGMCSFAEDCVAGGGAVCSAGTCQ